MLMKLLASSPTSPSRVSRSRYASGGSTPGLGESPIPLADENTWWLVSIAMMSLNLVIDQNAP